MRESGFLSAVSKASKTSVKLLPRRREQRRKNLRSFVLDREALIFRWVSSSL